MNGCKTGGAKITRGYHLKASFVIHTVGPIYSGSSMNAKQIASCYRNSLLLAMKHDLKSIFFPAISTGVFGYPIKKAAYVSIKTVHDFLLQRNTSLSVQFVLFDAHSLQVFKETFDEIVE